MLNEAGYSLQGNRKTTEGDSHPDRDAQFGYINTQVTAALAEQQPVISVDTKKKELVGDFRNNGREYRPQGNPEEVRVHDFLIKELGRAVPYGVYDLAANSGWVSVGVDHDTAAFAVNSIRQWWQAVGRARYPDATRLLITADGGGSNGSRVRLWKRELQKLANELGLDIVVSHLPPGTSKWNKIEHRLFSFISQNWRAKPLVSYRVIVELISATTTKTGLTVRCELDTGQYPSGIVVSDAEMAAINIKRAEFHGEWNYTISPNPHPPKSRVYLVTRPLTSTAPRSRWSNRSPTSRRVPAAMTTASGSARACSRAARFGVSPTTDCSCAEPSPIRSPTTTSPVAIPTRA